MRDYSIKTDKPIQDHIVGGEVVEPNILKAMIPVSRSVFARQSTKLLLEWCAETEMPVCFADAARAPRVFSDEAIRFLLETDTKIKSVAKNRLGIDLIDRKQGGITVTSTEGLQIRNAVIVDNAVQCVWVCPLCK